eukprot:SAG25_NODE_4428_length_817_cov_0.728412_2_plen_61_part_01
MRRTEALLHPCAVIVKCVPLYMTLYVHIHVKINGMVDVCVYTTDITPQLKLSNVHLRLCNF